VAPLIAVYVPFKLEDFSHWMLPECPAKVNEVLLPEHIVLEPEIVPAKEILMPSVQVPTAANGVVLHTPSVA
jgi:hypothetical protein